MNMLPENGAQTIGRRIGITKDEVASEDYPLQFANNRVLLVSGLLADTIGIYLKPNIEVLVKTVLTVKANPWHDDMFKPSIDMLVAKGYKFVYDNDISRDEIVIDFVVSIRKVAEEK